MKPIHFLLITVAVAITVIISCKSDKATPDYHGYPSDIGKIIIPKCAVPGCHTPNDKGAAAFLALDTWQDMFVGGSDGSCTIPYNTDNSTLFLFTNTYPDLGVSVPPTMPLQRTPLTRTQEITLRDWIAAGAPNKDGFVMWSDNPNRKKVYVSNQGCDNVAVFDEKTNLIMRFVDVGASPQIESPHDLQVSPDGQYWYVVFFSGEYMQKFRTSDDAFVGQADLGPGSWNTFAMSQDGTKAFAVSWEGQGRVAYVDLTTMTTKMVYQGGNLFVWPHGSALTNHDSTLYVTAQYGNFLYKIDVTDPMNPNINQVTLDGSNIPSTVSSLDPHALEVSPDGKYLYATCENSNDVRVLDLANDSLTAVIPTGVFPQEMSFSTTTPYLFVTCMEDTVTYPGTRGSISILNYHNNTFIKSLYSGFQPHGIGVDDLKGIVYVANRNASKGGPAPHHSTSCAGTDGYVTFIDLNRLKMIQNQFGTVERYETSVDPYEVAIRE